MLFNAYVLRPQIDISSSTNNTAIVLNDTIIFAKIALQNIPTFINGITASTSIIIAFSGTIIGLLYRDVFERDNNAKQFILLLVLFLILPLSYLSSVYTFLITGYVDSAVRIALTGLILSLFGLIVVILFALQRWEFNESKIINDKNVM